MTVLCLVCLSGCGQQTSAAGNPGIGTGMDGSVAADSGSEAGTGRGTGADGSEAGTGRGTGADGSEAEADKDTGDVGLKPGQAPSDTAALSGDSRTERFEILDADDDGKGTYDRYRKDSFYWYQKVIRNNSIDFE